MAMIVRTGRNAPRSKTGCSTCRIRKVKCDEQRPICSKCALARMRCDWDQSIPARRPVANHSVKRQETLIHPKQSQPATHTDHNVVDSAECGDERNGLAHSPEDKRDVAVRETTYAVSMPRSMLDSNIEMSNSLVLSPRDRIAFQYVPESLMVLRFGKPWKWSMLSYVHSNIAPRERGVMSAFIAVASMELRFRGLVQFSDSVVTQTSLTRADDLKKMAATHFHVAIKDLCSLLDRISKNEPSSDELEALFAMWFLILHCELYDSDLIRASQIHMNGIRSFISKYLQENSASQDRKLPPASEQLLLFITYIDVNLALGNLNGGRLSLDLMTFPRESPLAYDQIWESARICLPKLWGADYPAEEILDDVENYRGLSFLHTGQKLKLSLWQQAIAAGMGKDVVETRKRLWNRIEDVGREFNDLLTLARLARNSGGRRVMWTVYHGCLDYYACKVLYSCLDKAESSPEWMSKTIADLLAIAYKALAEDPQQLYRLSWSLAVAYLKARLLLSDFGLPSYLLEESNLPENVFIEYGEGSKIEEIG